MSRPIFFSGGMSICLDNKARRPYLGTMETKTTAARAKKTGQYTFSMMERLCTCGHRLGDHTAEAPHDCIVDMSGCGCAKFRPAKGAK